MTCTRTALTQDEIRKHLEQLPTWQLVDNALERHYDGQSYLEALEKLNAIAQLSEASDHHPELRLGWKHLTIRYWTHVANGVTELDFELAHRVEALLVS
ncbi:MAG TPA: 4a-hydroxytetrahydrobiopterin dehydratase [Coleofasciculaceae cyanobacterium]|jgi:4a-hydroxytetrahydrobiopterin dehydratase